MVFLSAWSKIRNFLAQEARLEHQTKVVKVLQRAIRTWRPLLVDRRYPLVNSHITVERFTMFNGKKTHELSMGPFSIAMSQSLLEGSYDFW